jgi:hypothetical protein
VGLGSGGRPGSVASQAVVVFVTVIAAVNLSLEEELTRIQGRWANPNNPQ